MMNKLRFGTFLAPNMLPVYQAIADEVGRQLKVETELVVEASYQNCVEDKNDVCFVCSLPFIEFERQGISPAVPIAAPVLRGERYQDKPIYFSDVIVRHDSPLKSFSDLRGRSWAYNEPLSQSGYGITRYHLVRLGEINGFFGKVVESGFHEKSIQMVINGEVDASAIDSQVLAIAMRDDPALIKSLRIIAVLGPSTIQPIAVSRRIPIELRVQIQWILINLHHKPNFKHQLQRGMIERLVPIGNSDYDNIRIMLDTCLSANFMKIR